MNKEKRICALCEKPITHTKGQAKHAFKYEIENGVHVQCQRTHEGILKKYRLSQSEYMSAVFEGLFEVSPELRETKAVKDFESRKKKAEKEIEKAFLNLKKKVEKEQK